MAGDGPLKRRWQKLAKQLGIAANVDWLQWQDRDTMAVLYENHDVLLFAAMHDTGGLVALAAMHHGLPVVCLKLGGPAPMVNGSWGHTVSSPAKIRSASCQEYAGRKLK